MKILTDESTIICNKPYGIELVLGIKDEFINGANYVSGFCAFKNESRLSVVEVDYKINADPSKNATAYCTSTELKESESWFQKLKEWLSGFFG